MRQKQHKTCTICSEPDLAWGMKEGKPRLYKGVTVNGNWTAGPELHVCNREPKVEEPTPTPKAWDPAPLDYIFLACGCGNQVIAAKSAVLEYGYPVCSKCQEFMINADLEATDTPVPTPADATPEEIGF